jgi:NAD(P)-dependent dehydrogenase (short-subunit alcohol dehydrogenase family)
MTKIAIVTGGTGALGGVVTRRFAEAGYEVHVTTSHELEPGRAVFAKAHVVDLSDFDAVRAFAANFERVDAMALTAGGYAGAKLDALTANDLERMLDVNFKTATYVLAAFATKLVAGSAAVVVGSQSFGGAEGMAAYAASKAAVVSMARSAALEWKSRGVRVNAVLPDVIDTPANRRAMPKADATHWVKPEQVADVIAWLCSEAASAVSGNAILVGV